MNKTLSFALLAGGILLIIVGSIAFDSTSSDISRFFTGAGIDKSIWLVVSGVVVTIVGLVGVSRNLNVT